MCVTQEAMNGRKKPPPDWRGWKIEGVSHDDLHATRYPPAPA